MKSKLHYLGETGEPQGYGTEDYPDVPTGGSISASDLGGPQHRGDVNTLSHLDIYSESFDGYPCD